MQVLRVPRGLAVGIILFIVLVSGAEVWAQAPTATTGAATSISASGATLNGTVNANGASTTVTFEYGTTVAYGSTVTAGQSPVTGSSDTAVSRAIAGLTSNTTYHFRVVGTNAGGTTYGADMTFTTLPEPPTVTTQAVSGITTTTATGNANITDLGNPNPTAHGVVWNTGGSPTTAGSLTDEGAVASTGAFTSNITGLSSNTTYYVRAYATNTAGTTYGSEVSFTTAAPAPTVTTGTATAVGLTGATLNGTVNANGASTTVTFEYGTTVAYGTTVTADQSPVTGSSDTAVSTVLAGLTSYTTYHFRVVGTNAGGTTYGADMTFTTLPEPPTVTTQAVSGITTTTATGNANITDLGNPNPTAHGVVWNTGGTPTTADSYTDKGAAASTGAFTSNITGLSSNTTYYLRAYATNTAGTTYGSEVSFTTVQRQVDLRVSALDTPDPVTAGSGAGNLTHTVTVTNAGPSDASGVTLSEMVSLPAGASIVSITPSGTTSYAPADTSPGTWTVGDLAAGASETLTIVMTVGADTADGATISSTATVTAANETLINTSDDSATENTTVQRQVDLRVSALDTPDPVTAGSGAGNLTHTVTVTNAGPSDASGVTLSETMSLPAGASIVSITPSGATFYAPANTSPGTWTVGNLAAGASETLTIVMTVGAGTAGGAIVSNTATITAANETLINTGDDTATENTTVVRNDDFGDAPDSYGTLLASNGARHASGAGVFLGLLVDAEPDGQPSPVADGDDLNPPGADDEDGVSLPAMLTAGVSASVVVDGGPSGGMLDAWVDFNGDGDFDDAGENLWGGGGQVLVAGPNNLSFTVPPAAVPGSTYARFRLSSMGGLLPTGAAPDGEVEDYRVQVGTSPGVIIIEKQTNPDGSVQSFEFSTSYSPNFFLADGETNNSGPLTAGVYSVSEINLPASWSLTSATCNDGSDPSAIGLDPGETVTCTFVNSATPGTIIIEKQTDPDGSAQSFEFSTSYSPNFTLADNETHNSGPLTAGTYSVSEINLPASWSLTSAVCDDGSDPSAIGLGPGETVTCTFSNTGAPGVIIIEKQTDPDGSVQSFEFSPSYGPNFTLADDETNNSGPLSPGVYSVSEVNIPASWSLTSAVCDDGSDPSAIGLETGETVTCVFNNSALDTDGDRIVDSDEGLAGEDRDGDGVPNYLDFDPSGYLYDEATGQILIGGSISVSGPGAITVIDDGSATGQYSWFHDGTQGDYTLTVNYPAGYAASVVCLDLGVLNPDATPDPLSLGAGENGSTGYLTSWDCGSNSYYSVLRVDATYPNNIINNNFPLAALAPIPALTDRGVMLLLLLLLVSGVLILRRGA